jgi:hypothetical protein
MTESQRQRPKRMRSGKKAEEGRALWISVVKALDMYPTNYEDGCDC